jgi:hypothetical protein
LGYVALARWPLKAWHRHLKTQTTNYRADSAASAQARYAGGIKLLLHPAGDDVATFGTFASTRVLELSK